MSEIKTRDKSKVGIKALDKSADIGLRMKNTLVKTKDRVDYIANTDAPSAEEYASDQVQNIASDAAHTTVDNTKSAVNRGKDAIRKRREKIKERANTDPVPDSPSSNGNHTGPQSTKPDAGDGAASFRTGTPSGRGGVTQSGNAAPHSTPGPATPRPRGNNITNPLPKPTTSQSPNPVKVPRQKPTRTVTHARNARTVGRASTRTIKGANQSTKVTIKTAKQAEKAAQKAAEASAKARKARRKYGN